MQIIKKKNTQVTNLQGPMGSLKRHFKPFLAIIILCHHNEAIIKLVRWCCDY